MKSIDILWGKEEEETVVVEDIIKEETVVEETKRATPIGIGSVLSDGYIVYAETDTEWLAVAPATKRADYVWGSHGTARNTISTTDGYANTDTLQALGKAAHPAADFAWNNSRSPTEGGTGSYLPAKDELNVIYRNKELIDAADTTGNFLETWHWSSTELGSYSAPYQYFSVGSQYASNDKNFSYWVVPMRKIKK